MQLRQPYVHVTIFFVAVLATVYSQTTPLFPVACELNVLIVLDRSDSVKGGFNKSRKFVIDVSEELQIGPLKHRVAMVVYSGPSYRREIFPWNFAKNNEEFVRITNGLRAIGCELDLVLVMDFSTTTDPIIRFYKELAQKLISALKIGPHYTQVAVVTFATVGKTRTKFNLKRYKTQPEVLHAIAQLETSGGTTAIGAGIKEGIKQTSEKEGARPGIATRVMIVFTDGWSNKGPEPEDIAREAVSQGFELYSVSYTKKVADAVTVNHSMLESIAQDMQHIYTDNNFEQLIEKVRRRNLKCM
ncbi:von Willebrand factor type A domain protein [Necator americanus]|uniref:von Willebrand factor type A domain protein n=1 Tax=Necator americanus TaxID=51031 RepID=W2TFZ2_NECAM|nr:von Willebrand factor type A domain protein [Necator americanus]ETN80514.1 von Willebrand factor type A domain protein [Necator americanus]